MSERSCSCAAAALLGLTVVSEMCLAGPRITCAKPIHEFGILSNQETVKHTFTLRNNGNEDLYIRSVRAGCGCATLDLDHERIKPGTSARLAVEMSLKGRHGKQRRIIYIQSNDTKTPRCMLQITGEIRRDVDLDPGRAVFGFAADRALLSKRIRVYSGTGKKFVVTGVDTDDEGFFTVRTDTVRDGLEYVVEVSLTGKGRQPGANFRGEMIVHTDRPGYRDVTVPVVAYLPKEITAAPERLVVSGLTDNGQSRDRYILVRSPLQTPFAVVGVTPPARDVVVKTDKLSDTRYRIKISNLAAKKEMDGQVFHIRIRKENGDETAILVPVVVRWSSPRQQR